MPVCRVRCQVARVHRAERGLDPTASGIGGARAGRVATRAIAGQREHPTALGLCRQRRRSGGGAAAGAVVPTPPQRIGRPAAGIGAGASIAGTGCDASHAVAALTSSGSSRFATAAMQSGWCRASAARFARRRTARSGSRAAGPTARARRVRHRCSAVPWQAVHAGRSFVGSPAVTSRRPRSSTRGAGADRRRRGVGRVLCRRSARRSRAGRDRGDGAPSTPSRGRSGARRGSSAAGGRGSPRACRRCAGSRCRRSNGLACRGTECTRRGAAPGCRGRPGRPSCLRRPARAPRRRCPRTRGRRRSPPGTALAARRRGREVNGQRGRRGSSQGRVRRAGGCRRGLDCACARGGPARAGAMMTDDGHRPRGGETT